MRRGFSLIELIIVIALIALVGGMIVVNAEAMLRGLGEEPVERILHKAVREARFQAAYLKEPTQVRYDEETLSFVLDTQTGSRLNAWSTGLGENSSLDVIFEQILPQEGLTRVLNEETVEIPVVTFRPDRSSTPFQVTFDLGREEFTQRYDPFSDIVIEDSRER